MLFDRVLSLQIVLIYYTEESFYKKGKKKVGLKMVDMLCGA